MKKEYLYAGVSIFCWSTVAVITKLLLQDLNQFQLLWASSFFAGLFLLVVNLVTGNLKQLKQWKLKDFAISALCGIPGTFLCFTTQVLPVWKPAMPSSSTICGPLCAWCLPASF